MNSQQSASLDRPFLARLTKVLGVILLALLVFWAGTEVGRRQSEFGGRWGSSYREVFLGDESPFGFRGSMMRSSDMMFSANGAAGQVIAVNLPSVAVKGRDEVEKVIVIGPQTVIRRIGAPVSTTDIRVGDVMIAVGEPDSTGRIVATFVRLLPPPPNGTSTPARTQ